ncbi:MAG TPA: RpiB/LacA/LacB family sugar-phosphate isomerase [Candidatus Paceibacterota bacterium]|nr:RpiB/LacA/LacB family sugar-phosphate isomerase [Candidatus Paceibacterota bacterium]
MTIYFGADHRGFQLKEKLKAALVAKGYEVADLGATTLVPDDDYPEYAAAVAEHIGRAPEVSRGILVCGSGAGMDITVNKFRYIRSVLGFKSDQVYAARHDDDVNVLTIAADYTDEDEAQKMVTVFLSTPFASDVARYLRRVGKVIQIDES